MIASSVLMIRPTAFGYNTETASSNSFQHTPAYPSSKIQLEALKEFEALHQTLTSNGVDVILHNDTVAPVKPDAIFPNNWFSTHADGSIFLYPMLSPVRRKERREDIVKRLRENFQVKQVIDLSPFEMQEKFLEGTGSMVFDHKNKAIYAALSPRTDKALLEVVADELKYALSIFQAHDRNGKDIYHTNVAMNISDELVVVCFDCIIQSQLLVKNQLLATGKEVIEISTEQMENFCGNMLMLKNNDGEKLMVMSERAFKALNKNQIGTIEKHAKIIHSPLKVIETIGGGSARCMLAEIFLPLNPIKGT
jgi:hypothetical protein